MAILTTLFRQLPARKKRRQTCDEVRQPLVDVHQAVGAGVGHSSERVALQFFPRRLCDADVVVLHPALVGVVVDVRPVVTCRGLAFVHEHRVESVWYLQGRKNPLNPFVEVLEFVILSFLLIHYFNRRV